MNYTLKEINKIFSLSDLSSLVELTIETVSTDSRTLISPSTTLFFALPGGMSDGHDFIESAHCRGVRSFVVNQLDFEQQYSDSTFFVVPDVLEALQKLATHHQKSFPELKKIAITGSNGKTIIKEWLYQMLYDEFNIVKSPKSYNSQIGVAVSLLGIQNDHELGIFEVGISKKGEMENHIKMLAPDIGLITNIGSAHDEGFSSRKEKLEEKLILFRNVDSIIYRKKLDTIDGQIESMFPVKELFTWGVNDQTAIQVLSNVIVRSSRYIVIKYKGKSTEIKLRFTDKASFENCMHCIAVMCFLEISLDEIKLRINRISGLHMRMEMTTGLQQSILVNDAYSADLDALQVALEFVKQQAGKREKIAILSAFDQSGKEEQYVFDKIIEQLIGFGFSEVIYISQQIFDIQNLPIKVLFYKSKEALLLHINNIDIHHKIVLIKGARRYELEDVSHRLSSKGHSASLEINLNALEQNLRVYKSCLETETGIIAVVKASAYGAGSSEVARLLERKGVNYLAVAFTDEGMLLREAGIKTPIIVFNPDLTSLLDVIRYSLEPEVYDFEQLYQIVEFSNQNNEEIRIHLKLDTGMHRLGFQVNDIEHLCELLSQGKKLVVKSIFSHLASSEDESDDDYSKMQFDLFDKMYEDITIAIKQFPKRHILNSGGISRFPNRQYDFVRLGIGMYGIDKNQKIQPLLKKVHRLTASLIQVKKLKSGDSIGYNRSTILEEDKVVGIVNIGYADGIMRSLGNENYCFKIRGMEVNILGNVCMDVTIIDLSNVADAKVGDRVVVFDASLPIEHFANAAGTIPYEILSRISTRIRRRFVWE